MAKEKPYKEKHPIRSIRISDATFEKLKTLKKRGKSWDRFLRENYVEGK
jgi:predicted CopG family antitoxin